MQSNSKDFLLFRKTFGTHRKKSQSRYHSRGASSLQFEVRLILPCNQATRGKKAKTKGNRGLMPKTVSCPIEQSISRQVYQVQTLREVNQQLNRWEILWNFYPSLWAFSGSVWVISSEISLSRFSLWKEWMGRKEWTCSIIGKDLLLDQMCQRSFLHGPIASCLKHQERDTDNQL